jgi:hypothetical protein
MRQVPYQIATCSRLGKCLGGDSSQPSLLIGKECRRLAALAAHRPQPAGDLCGGCRRTTSAGLVRSLKHSAVTDQIVIGSDLLERRPFCNRRGRSFGEFA